MKVGDYVRIDGYISKIGHIKTSSSGKTYIQWKQPNGLLASGNINIIEKSSPNIIDLIKVGDYINGHKIIKISEDFANRKILIYGYDNGERQVAITIYEDEIKSIVTKEQFESMEYKVGDK